MTDFIPFRRAIGFEGGRFMYGSAEAWRKDFIEWRAFHRRRVSFHRKRSRRMAGK